MISLQIACGGIVALFVAAHVIRQPAHARAFIARFATCAFAGWLGEDSLIRAYGYYAYDPSWSLMVDRVPLLIVCIWPVVIESAGQLARDLFRNASPLRVAIAGGAIVCADAALIEPIAVHARLWTWTHPGLFGVPLIGVLGWGLFAAACLYLLNAPGARRFRVLGVALGAPAFTHVCTVAIHAFVLRGRADFVTPAKAVVIAWAVCIALAALARFARLQERVMRAHLILRIPGAMFFFVLLGLHARDAGWLILYAIAFMVPYLALLDLRGAALNVIRVRPFENRRVAVREP